ncbi:MAG: hypothetical protein AB2A00_05110 [Myxococcota bacterium]
MDPRTIKLVPPMLPATFPRTSLGTGGFPPYSAPFLLFFRPARFFEYVLDSCPNGLVILGVLLTGLAAPVGAQVAGNDSNEAVAAAFAAGKVKAVAALSPIAAIIHYYVWGALSQLRLRLCGVKDPDAQLVRTSYVLAELVEALPITLWLAVTLVAFALDIDVDVAALGVPVLVVSWLWSYRTHYVAARVLFGAPRGRTVMVFSAPFLAAALLVGAVALEDLTSNNDDTAVDLEDA